MQREALGLQLAARYAELAPRLVASGFDFSKNVTSSATLKSTPASLASSPQLLVQKQVK
jgi:hypothetical protein